jgi:MFS family permease
MIVGTVGGGLLGQINLSLPYIARAALVLIALGVGYRTMFDIGFTPRAVRFKGILGEMRKVARAGVTYGWRSPAVRLLVMYSFVFGAFFSWAWYAWQPYFLELYGSDAVWLSGLIAALFALAGIAGNSLVRRLAKPGRRRTTILLGASAASSAAMVATGLFRTFWVAVPVFLLGAVAGGLLGPVRQTYLHQSIPTSERATLVSFDSLVGSLGSVGGQTGLGFLSQERSVPAGFVVGGLTTFLAIPIFARLRSLHEPADRISAAAPELETAPTIPPSLAGDELPSPG